jgi:uncharacterized membrane protein
MRRGEASPYRPGGFIFHPVVLAVVLVGVPGWLAVYFVGESTHGVVGVIVAVVLVVLGLWLGYFVFMAMTVEAVGLTIWLVDRTERKKRHRSRGGRRAADLRYLYLASAPVLLAALLLGFGFGYLGGGVLWGLYGAVLTVGVIAIGELLAWRSSSARP